MRTHTRGAPTVFFIRLLWPLLLAVAAAVDLDASGGISFMGGNYDGHPMLYFSRGDVEEMQYAAAGTHRDMAKRIRDAGETMLEHPEGYLPPWNPAEFSARWNEVYGNNLGVLSMFCLLYPHRAGALDLVKDYMERMAAQPSWYIFCLSFSFNYFLTFLCVFRSMNLHITECLSVGFISKAFGRFGLEQSSDKDSVVSERSPFQEMASAAGCCVCCVSSTPAEGNDKLRRERLRSDETTEIN